MATIKNPITVVKGSEPTLITKSVTANGTYNASDDNADGYSSVSVNVPNPSSGSLSITENGVYDVTNKASAIVNVEFVPIEEKQVNFYDYDGTLLYSYSEQEALDLSGLPALPTHEGLTMTSWNWSLADVKAECVRQIVNVGACGYPTDGKAHIFINLPSDKLSLWLHLNVNLNKIITIDWGDNSPTETMTQNTSNWKICALHHTYSDDGKYDITISGEDNSCAFARTESGNTRGISRLLRNRDESLSSDISQNNSYINLIEEVWFSKTIIMMNNEYNNSGMQLAGCNYIKSILINDERTFLSNMNFFDCNRLKCLIIPKNITISNQSLYMGQAYQLNILSVPIELSELTPSGFYGSRIIRSFTIPSNVTQIPPSCFANSLLIREIYISDKITSIGDYAFDSCGSLYDINIDGNLLTNIGTASFKNCSSIEQIKFPHSVTNIGANSFQGCKSLNMIDCTKLTITDNTINTILGVNAFYNIPSYAQIIFATEAIKNVYAQATNWSAYASKMTYVGA